MRALRDLATLQGRGCLRPIDEYAPDPLVERSRLLSFLPPHMTLIDVIERWAEIHPEAVAFTALPPEGDAGTSITTLSGSQPKAPGSARWILTP